MISAGWREDAQREVGGGGLVPPTPPEFGKWLLSLQLLGGLGSGSCDWFRVTVEGRSDNQTFWSRPRPPPLPRCPEEVQPSPHFIYL